ncbi:RNA polymerase sigma factor [Solirubrobacter sp. CPCC 204708]|uniref:RNA polymerase sigma factor n=1 Tax=Solirubrobacter deserti TaxID=2282478 RepID=A0ABT4RUQ7_9ACTN|nr:RNA polymerase sigma factor [Solirubrobacter deserti]MDA0142123.1 RNA polymerase sigma factor [Solirubrobacter deserti]
MSTLELPDATIIAASVSDPPAFAAVFDRHWAELRRYCVSRAAAVGEDLAAETFRLAFDRRRRYDARYADARPWLYGIATNLLRRHFRDAARRGVPLFTRAFGFEDDALGRVEAQALGPDLAAALKTVAAADRDALLLHAWAELTYTEIAHATGIPVGTVRSRIHRARTQLRAHLEEIHDERA